MIKVKSGGPFVTVVSVTLNAGSTIDVLAKSLSQQTSKDFVWLIKDGGSTDDTLDIVRSYQDRLNIQVIQNPDEGIYSALNQSIEHIKTDFYVVAGADDHLFPAAIENFTKHCGQADIAAAPILFGDKLIDFPEKSAWRYGIGAVLSSHSIGCMIRTKLHDDVGRYDLSFPITSDQDFLFKAIESGARVTKIKDPSGVYMPGGFSSDNMIKYFFEYAGMMVKNGYSSLPQLALLAYRVLSFKIKS